KPVFLDVGNHRLKIESDGYVPVERDIVAADGETGRVVAVTMQHVPVATTTDTPPVAKVEESDVKRSRPIPWTVYALSGVAIAGAAGFTVFGLQGDSARSNLDSKGCAPHCPSDDVDRMSRNYLIADVALGVGIVA